MNPHCKGTGKDGRRCKLRTLDGSEYCRHHQPETDPEVDHITVGLELPIDMLFHVQIVAGRPDSSSALFDERWPEIAGELGHLDRLILDSNVPMTLEIHDPRSPGKPRVETMRIDGVPFAVTFHPVPEGLAFVLGAALFILRSDNWTRAMGKGTLEAITARNTQAGIALPSGAAEMECTFLDIGYMEDSGDPVTTQFFPMATFIEAREIARTIGGHLDADQWTPVRDERALQREPTARELNVIISAKDWAGWEQANIPPERLLRYIEKMDTDAVFLYYAALALVMKHGRATVPIDELIGMIGWEPRDREDRLAMRRHIAKWLGHFNAIRVVGHRHEKHRQSSSSKEFLDLTIDAGLFHADTSRMFLGFDSEHEPVLVTLTATPWLQRLTKHKRGDVLQRFGNLRTIVDIPDGKPGGKWARGIGLALYQYWREESSTATIARIGEAKVTRARFSRPLTRQYLLTLFGCKPLVTDLTTGQHPERARDYWDGAVEYLREYKVVDSVDYPTISVQRGPAFWEEWLAQPIIMNPHRDILLGIAALRYAKRSTLRFYEVCEQIQADYPDRSNDE